MNSRMYPLGDPYQDDTSWQDLEVGDTVKIKPSWPHGNQFGKLITIDEETGTYTVEFPNSATMSYDGDALIRIPKKK